MKFISKNSTNKKIKNSKDIPKKEKKNKKIEKISKSKIGSLLIKLFKTKENEGSSLREQIFSMIYFEIIGAILCLLVLFAISGGKNYIKLYMELNKLINVYDTILSNYYGELDKEKLINNAIKSMVNSVGDDYTIYTDNETSDEFLEELEGTYEGIGCTVSMTANNEIIVISIFEGGPAKLAGLQVGDIITNVDEHDFENKTSEDMANYIKNSSKSKIKLTIKRENEKKNITIERKRVEIPSVTSKIIEKDNKKIGYIDISIFSSVTYGQFKKHLEELEKQDIDGLIIDVRYDTGGYLSVVTDISKLFLKKGKVIYQLEDDDSKEKIKDDTKEYRTYPIVVLINESSASASEILASAIKESYGGIIVGTNSYGKGTVQKTEILKDGSMIKYTAQKWLTPKGNWINEVGVEPTIKIELDITSETDNQINTALEEIINKLN